MLERFDLLVRRAREQSGNRTYSTTQGIQQREMERFGNDAQKHLFGQISQTHSSLYTATTTIDSVANQAAYTLSSSVYLKSNIIKVEYSSNGNALMYRPLTLRTARQETSVPGYPDSYFLRDGALVISPYPLNSIANAFRVEYQYKIPTVGIRRGKISARGLSGSALSTITLSATGLIEETEDDLEDGWVDYISVVDFDGTVLASEIKVTSYDAGTNVITVSKTLGASETCPVDAYIVFGKYATTHSFLPENADRYIVQYMAMAAQLRDSNQEALANSELLRAMGTEILAEINDLEEDVMTVPIMDRSMLNYAEDL